MPGAMSHIVRRASVALVLCATASVALGQTTNPQAQLSQPQPKVDSLTRADNRVPDANAIMLLREQQAKRKSFEAANIERKRQLAEDSSLLLKLAEELNIEVVKAPTDALSPTEMRKIEDIERLAHNVQQKMKLTVGAS